MTQDEQAIRSLVDTWMAASKAGDIDTVLSLMADDVVFMVPGQEPFGKEAFQSASASMTGAKIEGTSEIAELQVVGELAYMRGRLQMRMTAPDGKAIERYGYTLTLFRKQPDGRWLLSRDANMLTTKE